MNCDHYAYRVTWSAEDSEHLGLCAEFASLSWLAATPEDALAGIRRVVVEAVADLEASGEPVPTPLSEKHYSGEFRSGFRRNCIAHWRPKLQSRASA